MSQQPFPTAATPAVAQANGNWYFTTPWMIWLSQLAAQPAAPSAVTPTGSPFSYIASGSGTLSIVGGTVSAITLTRGGATVPVGNVVQMANKDVVSITYSAVPSISFVPG